MNKPSARNLLFLRSLSFSIGMVLATLVFAPLSVLTFPLPLRQRYLFITQWSRFVLWWLNMTCHIDCQILGKENIPKHASIILCKHQSMWETLALQSIFPQQAWILKRELLWVPFFGWGLAMLKPIAIDRKGGRKAIQQLVMQGRQRLENNQWVVVFPEGTRTLPGQKGRYALGGGILAEKTQQLVVPVAHNAGCFWRKKQFIKTPGTITLSIGKPLKTQGLSAKVITEHAEQWIESEVSRIQSVKNACK